MSDFFQNGVITTLQKLGHQSLESMESRLKTWSRERPVTLLLPALYSELNGPAMKPILEQLNGADYFSQITVTMDEASPDEFEEAKSYLKTLFPDIRVVWNNGPKISELYEHLVRASIPVHTPGKGRSVWMALGYILATENSKAIVLHDCDIVTYDRWIPARLAAPIMDPGSEYEFVKGFYARAGDRLYGRVTRLLVTPLVRALSTIAECHPLLDYFDSFRYPLAGEFAMSRRLAETIRVAPDWGLEIASLYEVYRHAGIGGIAQVELADHYDHKHQVLAPGETDRGLGRMSRDIVRAFLSILRQEGIGLASRENELPGLYHEEALDAVRKFRDLASFNDLVYDINNEIATVTDFSGILETVLSEDCSSTDMLPAMPSWKEVNRLLPNFSHRLVQAVEEDNR